MPSQEPTRLDHRTFLARKLAGVSLIIAAVSIDADLAEFASDADREVFRDGLAVARDEVTKAECRLHDLIFGVKAAA